MLVFRMAVLPAEQERQGVEVYSLAEQERPVVVARIPAVGVCIPAVQEHLAAVADTQGVSVPSVAAVRRPTVLLSLSPPAGAGVVWVARAVELELR
jgi:hypothetical protein